MTTKSHGMSHTKVYKIWYAMIRRCENPNDKDYKYYGGRGITVCERWQDVRNFYADMGDRPEGMSIDRIDNDSGYCPENCRWATWEQQAKNQRRRMDSPCLIGRRFGRRLVISERTVSAGNGGRTRMLCECRCDCRAVVEVEQNSLLQGQSRACRSGRCRDLNSLSLPYDDEHITLFADHILPPVGNA